MNYLIKNTLSFEGSFSINNKVTQRITEETQRDTEKGVIRYSVIGNHLT